VYDYLAKLKAERGKTEGYQPLIHQQTQLNAPVDVLSKSVDELEVSFRTYNSLKNAGIKTIGELVQKSEPDLLRTRKFYRREIKELNDVLTAMGLELMK